MKHSKHLAIPAFLAVIVLAIGVTTQAASGASNPGDDGLAGTDAGSRTQLPPSPVPSPAPLPSPSPSPSPTPTTPYPGVDAGR